MPVIRARDKRHDFAVRLLRAGATLAQCGMPRALLDRGDRKYAHVIEGDVQRRCRAM